MNCIFQVNVCKSLVMAQKKIDILNRTVKHSIKAVRFWSIIKFNVIGPTKSTM